MSARHLLFGELLQAAGLVPRGKLEQALAHQDGRPLGEVLAGMGCLATEEIPGLVAVQEALREGRLEPLAARLRLGELLREAGVIDAAALEAALAESRASGRRLGETLVDAGHLSRKNLARFLRRQQRLTAVALAGLALSGALHLPAAAADRTRIHVQASVLHRAAIERQRVPQHVEISAQDVARGYVELDEPVEVGIRANHPVSIGFALRSAQLAAVDVRAVEGGELREAGVLVAHKERGLRTQRVALRLRLQLAPGATPGAIAFPLALTLEPL